MKGYKEVTREPVTPIWLVTVDQEFKAAGEVGGL